jgi:hypothetical protein
MTNEDEEPLKLITVCGPTEGQMIEEMLLNNGIRCTLQGDVSSTPLPATGDLDEVRVWVKESDAAKAQELVEGYFTPVGKDELTEGDPELGVDDPDEPGGFTG